MIEPTEYSAFAALPEDNNGAAAPHHILAHGTLSTDAGTPSLVINLPVTSLQQARKGTTQARGTIGFRLTVDFELDGKPYELHTTWVALRRRSR